eukprot:4193810-Amphidinium_carterae.2
MVKTPDLEEPEVHLSWQHQTAASVVIIDYGLAQTYCRERTKLCGTPGYIPPETWDFHKWHGGTTTGGFAEGQLEETGRWSVEVLCSGAKNLQEVAVLTTQKRPPYDRIPDELMDVIPLLERLLEVDPSGLNCGDDGIFALLLGMERFIAIGCSPIAHAARVHSRHVNDIHPAMFCRTQVRVNYGPGQRSNTNVTISRRLRNSYCCSALA